MENTINEFGFHRLSLFSFSKIQRNKGFRHKETNSEKSSEAKLWKVRIVS